MHVYINLKVAAAVGSPGVRPWFTATKFGQGVANLCRAPSIFTKMPQVRANGRSPRHHKPLPPALYRPQTRTEITMCSGWSGLNHHLVYRDPCEGLGRGGHLHHLTARQGLLQICLIVNNKANVGNELAYCWPYFWQWIDLLLAKRLRCLANNKEIYYKQWGQ